MDWFAAIVQGLSLVKSLTGKSTSAQVRKTSGPQTPSERKAEASDTLQVLRTGISLK